MPEPTDATIEAWIRPATISLTDEDIRSYRDVVAHVASKLIPSEAPSLVAVAHQIGRPETKQWLTELVRAEREDFVVVNNESLLARVACCIAVRSLENADTRATLVGLLVQSATFTGATAPIAELARHADVAVANAAAAARQRRADRVPVMAEIRRLVSEKPAEAAAAEELSGQAGAIMALAEAIDDLGAEADRRAKIVDEEYGALWWSYSHRRAATGTPWEEVKPISRRVVLIADELRKYVTHVPGPPMIRGLLASALGNEAGRAISLEEIALAAADEQVRVAPNAKETLLPISSAVAQIRELGGGTDTWKEVLGKALGLNVKSTTPALDAALQLFREVEIGSLL